MKQKKGSRVKQEKDGIVSKLKARIRRLEKEKRELVSKLKTLEAAFEKTVRILKGSVEDLTVEELIEGAKKEQTIKKQQEDKEPRTNNPDECPQCRDVKEFKIMEIRGGKIAICRNCTYRSKL